MDITRYLSALPYRIAGHRKRIGQAWRLARGRLTQDDGRDLYHTVTRLAGWHVLETLENDTVLENLLDEFEDHPRLEDYVTDACVQVSRKWESPGDDRFAAQDWARSLVLEYASDEGVTLIEHVAEPETAEA